MAFAQWLNQNSYVLVAFILFIIALAVVGGFFRRRPVAWGALGLLAVALVAGNLFLRVGVSDIETAAQFDQLLAAHQPVVLEVYSNY